MARIPSLLSAAAELALLSGEDDFRNAIRLSDIEKAFLALVIEGLDDPQIAGRMGIPEFLIRNICGTIAEKLALRAFLPAPAGTGKRINPFIILSAD